MFERFTERDELIEACEQYLIDLHTTNWGKTYDMFQTESRKAAAEHVADLVISVAEFLQGYRREEVA